MPSEEDFLSEEELLSFPQKNINSDARNMCLNGMILSVISFCIWFISRCFFLSVDIRGTGLFGFPRSYIFYLFFASLYTLFAIIGFVKAKRGYKKVAQGDLKSRKRAILGFVFSANILFTIMDNMILFITNIVIPEKIVLPYIWGII